MNPQSPRDIVQVPDSPEREDSEYTLGTQDTYSAAEDHEEPTQSDFDFEVSDEDESIDDKFLVTEKDLRKVTNKNELQDMLLRAQERVIEIQIRIQQLDTSPVRAKTRSRTRASRMQLNTASTGTSRR